MNRNTILTDFILSSLNTWVQFTLRARFPIRISRAMVDNSFQKIKLPMRKWSLIRQNMISLNRRVSWFMRRISIKVLFIASLEIITDGKIRIRMTTMLIMDHSYTLMGSHTIMMNTILQNTNTTTINITMLWAVIWTGSASTKIYLLRGLYI